MERVQSKLAKSIAALTGDQFADQTADERCWICQDDERQGVLQVRRRTLSMPLFDPPGSQYCPSCNRRK